MAERNRRGMDYALNNPEFIGAVAGVLASKAAIPEHLVGRVQAQIISAIANLTLDIHEFAKGDHYQASLHIVNTVSSTALGILTPWGGNASDAINIAGAFATAYTYGFFWG